MSARFHLLENIDYSDGILGIRLAELHEGKPDSLIGLPLHVTDSSEKYIVQFSEVGGFHVEVEPCNTLSRQAIRLSPFLFEERESKYLATSAECARMFAPDITKLEAPIIRHYVVYSEHFVIHVLCSSVPTTVQVNHAGV